MMEEPIEVDTEDEVEVRDNNTSDNDSREDDDNETAEMTNDAAGDEEDVRPKKKAPKKRRYNDHSEYVRETKKEKEAEEREKREYFDYLENEALQEHLYLATIIKEQCLETAPMMTQTKKHSSTRRAGRRHRSKRRRFDIADSFTTDMSSCRSDTDDDIQIVKVVGRGSDLTHEEQLARRRERYHAKNAAIKEEIVEIMSPDPTTSHASKKRKLPTRPTQLKLRVFKQSFGHDEAISFELIPEEYEFLIADATRQKCPGHTAILATSTYPAAPVAAFDGKDTALCPRCHAMMFLRHCGHAITYAASTALQKP
ncbi:Aste57867_18556 [Aphanomyces stellatus]|uniref:Aste57867_18556 protein n=1 Tax=Aphanomyces stellatus TaxID=120398 RepID=A0A485LC89_9STRA|nr:hypothetical protein As57867_018494 [Aphanomyces stellatus]VFT95292.1 Aste57867_18556 [Aphanomyces stellatus]